MWRVSWATERKQRDVDLRPGRNRRADGPALLTPAERPDPARDPVGDRGEGPGSRCQRWSTTVSTTRPAVGRAERLPAAREEARISTAEGLDRRRPDHRGARSGGRRAR